MTTTTAHKGRLGSVVDALDLFCGFGGSSQGIHAAGAEVKVAANHSELAIECHAANYPDVDHRRADLSDPDRADYIDPVTLPPATFLWASPSCKFHSPANAAKIYARGPQASLFDDGEEFDEVAYANSERSRVTMLCPLRYAAKHRPEMVVVENVVEAAKWGPARDGSTFRWWLEEWEKLGYEHECLFLNSMFFPPCPQSRDRMYVVIWRKGNTRPDLAHRPRAVCNSDRCQGRHVDAYQAWKPRKAGWPLERWGKYGAQYTYRCPDCYTEVAPVAWPAYSAIDWSRLGPTMAERRDNGTTLAESTMDRVRRGLVKFGDGPPILIPAKAVWGSDRSVAEPMTTQTSQQSTALVTKGIVFPRYGHTYERPGQTRAKSLADPLFAQHGTLSYGFAHMPFVAEMRGGGSVAAGQHPIIDPLHSVTAGGFHHALNSMPAMFQKVNGGPTDTAWHLMDDPLNSITGRDTTALMVLPWIDQWRSDPIGVQDQLATVMSHLRHALASVTPTGDPITDEDMDRVRFRMLEPDPELRRAMSFGDDYILLGNKTQRTSGLGNAVTPPVASWITERCLATLRGGLAAA
jgi:DNA (cytosine-5)-methyltransferase 1